MGPWLNNVNTKSKIGPFLDPDSGLPNNDPDFAAETLCNQYNYFACDASSSDVLEDMFFTIDDVEKSMFGN